MHLESCTDFLVQLLGPATAVAGEFGVTAGTSKVIGTIGYATNLTPQTVDLAVQQKVDLIVTHHDAWEFVYGMKADLFLTAEKSLYTVQCADSAGISLVVGSHTFTELPGVKALVDRIARQFPEIKTVRLCESLMEAGIERSRQGTRGTATGGAFRIQRDGQLKPVLQALRQHQPRHFLRHILAIHIA